MADTSSDWWNVDSGTTNCLVPKTFPISNCKTGTITVRTANDQVMESSTKGYVHSPIPGITTIEAHQIDGLVEPLLSLSEVTDHGIGVIFLKKKGAFREGPRRTGVDGGKSMYCRDCGPSGGSIVLP